MSDWRIMLHAHRRLFSNEVYESLVALEEAIEEALVEAENIGYGLGRQDERAEAKYFKDV